MPQTFKILVARPTTLLAVIATWSVADAANGGVHFFDDFEGEVAQLNYDNFANWTVSDGTVDVIGNGFFDYYPGNGLYVDMDGSTNDAGVLESIPIFLPAGTHELSFDLGDGQIGPNIMTVTVGSLVSDTLTTDDAGIAPVFSQISYTFDVPEDATVTIRFDHEGGAREVWSSTTSS